MMAITTRSSIRVNPRRLSIFLTPHGWVRVRWPARGRRASASGVCGESRGADDDQAPIARGGRTSRGRPWRFGVRPEVPAVRPGETPAARAACIEGHRAGHARRRGVGGGRSRASPRPCPADQRFRARGRPGCRTGRSQGRDRVRCRIGRVPPAEARPNLLRRRSSSRPCNRRGRRSGARWSLSRRRPIPRRPPHQARKRTMSSATGCRSSTSNEDRGASPSFGEKSRRPGLSHASNNGRAGKARSRGSRSEPIRSPAGRPRRRQR